MHSILAVDDSASMRQMVSFTLKSAGYNVVEAVDGQDAYEKAQGRSFDLVLTDQNMPRMDGISLTKKLRETAQFKSTPILILTTLGELPETAEQAPSLAIMVVGVFSFDAINRLRDLQITAAQREEVLKGLDSGKLTFESGLSSRVFFGVVYQTVMEGMFADPIYGGNKDKVGWKMLGFPGVVQVNAQNIAKYKNKQYKVDPVGIADMS